MISRHEEKHHMCLSIEGALRRKDRELNGWITDDDGRILSGKEVRALLKKAQYEGKRVLPIGDCDRFDYQTGCCGHGVTLLVHDYEFEEGNG